MLAKYLLLSVEDDPKISSLVTLIAEQSGFDTRVAKNGKELVSLYTDLKPDVIVLDIVMPEMDGIEVMHFLKEQNSKTHIIILSGYHDYSKMASVLAEAQNFSITKLDKPFRVTDLRRILDDIKAFLSKSGKDMSAEDAV